MRSRCRAAFGSLALLLVLATLSGCAVTPASAPATKAEPQAAGKTEGEGGGFTVQESAVVDAGVAADFDTAVKLLKSGEYEKGVELLKRATERAPGHTAPYINLAMAYQKMNKLPEAEESIKQALRVNPAHPVANTEYGLIYRKTGRFAEAREVYERTLKQYPAYLPARKNLGILCDLYLRDLDCALTQYRLYSAAMPDDKTVEIWIADLQRRQTQGAR